MSPKSSAGYSREPKRAKSTGCGRSSMVERQLPKLHTRVRFPSPAPTPCTPSQSRHRRDVTCALPMMCGRFPCFLGAKPCGRTLVLTTVIVMPGGGIAGPGDGLRRNGPASSVHDGPRRRNRAGEERCATGDRGQGHRPGVDAQWLRNGDQRQQRLRLRGRAQLDGAIRFSAVLESAYARAACATIRLRCAPSCRTRSGARSWCWRGAAKAEIVAAIKDGIGKHALPPSRSRRDDLHDVETRISERQGRNWVPHLMFYFPRSAAATWGADLPGAPPMLNPQFQESPEALSVVMVPVTHWSDGTPAPAM